MQTILISLLVFVVALLLGVPILISIGISCISIWLMEPHIVTTPVYMFQAIVTSLDSFVLIAVPLFILAGQIMAKGGIANKLFDFLHCSSENIELGFPVQ